MVRNRVTGIEKSLRDRGVSRESNRAVGLRNRGQILAQFEKARPDPVLPQQRRDFLGVFRMRPVVKRERDRLRREIDPRNLIRIRLATHAGFRLIRNTIVVFAQDAVAGIERPEPPHVRIPLFALSCRTPRRELRKDPRDFFTVGVLDRLQIFQNPANAFRRASGGLLWRSGVPRQFRKKIDKRQPVGIAQAACTRNQRIPAADST